MAFTVQQSWEHCPTGHLPSVFNKSTTVQQSWEHYSTGHAEQQSCYSSQYSTVQLLKSVGLRALFKRPHTEKLVCCHDYLDH